MNKTVSVVLLQHGGSEMTHTALASLVESSLDVVFEELILVDNGTPKAERELFEDVRMTRVLLPSNKGYVKGTNAGWRIARGDYVLLCNNDIALSRTCISRLKRAMDEDLELGWVSACFQQGGWKAFATEFPEPILKELDDTSGMIRDGFNRWSDTLKDAPQLVYHPVSEATVVMVTREASDKIGAYWDELVYNHSHDYGLRLAAEGYKMAACHNAVFWHNLNHPTLNKLDPDGKIAEANRARSDMLMNERWGDAWTALAA